MGYITYDYVNVYLNIDDDEDDNDDESKDDDDESNDDDDEQVIAAEGEQKASRALRSAASFLFWRFFLFIFLFFIPKEIWMQNDE